MDIPSVKSLIHHSISFYLTEIFLPLGTRYYYSRGGLDSLPWTLVPTVRWVNALNGIPFIKVPQTGYVSHSCRFITTVPCPGLQFLVISMTALAFSYIYRMRIIKGEVGRMVLSALASYLLTIPVSGFRIPFPILIPICLGMSGTVRIDVSGSTWVETVGSSDPTPARAWSIWSAPKQSHVIIGTVVYFTALFAVCRLGGYVSRKYSAAPGTPHRGNSRAWAGLHPIRTLGRWAVPVFWYLSIVSGISFLNRAYRDHP